MVVGEDVALLVVDEPGAGAALAVAGRGLDGDHAGQGARGESGDGAGLALEVLRGVGRADGRRAAAVVAAFGGPVADAAADATRDEGRHEHGRDHAALALGLGSGSAVGGRVSAPDGATARTPGAVRRHGGRRGRPALGAVRGRGGGLAVSGVLAVYGRLCRGHGRDLLGRLGARRGRRRKLLGHLLTGGGRGGRGGGRGRGRRGGVLRGVVRPRSGRGGRRRLGALSRGYGRGRGGCGGRGALVLGAHSSLSSSHTAAESGDIDPAERSTCRTSSRAKPFPCPVRAL